MKGWDEKSKARNKAWRAANQAHVRAHDAERDKARALRKSQRDAARYRADRDRILARIKSYFRTVKGRAAIKAAGLRRRSRGPASAETILMVQASYAPFCSYCSAPATSIDHVVSLKRGGTSDFENLVPACRSCNSSKGSKDLLQWLTASNSS